MDGYPDRGARIGRGTFASATGEHGQLTEQVAKFVGRLRSQPFASAFQRAPGIAESVEWAEALVGP
jgi:hypothetical protein